MPVGSGWVVQVLPPSTLATTTGPDGAAEVAMVDPTAQHRRAVAHETAWSDWTGAGRLDVTSVPCQGAATVDEVDVEPPAGPVAEGVVPHADAVVMTRTQTASAVRRPPVRVEARLAGTAHPSPAGPAVVSPAGPHRPIARDCCTEGRGDR